VTGEKDLLACKLSALNPIGVTGTTDLTLQGSMESRPQSMPVESSVAGGDGWSEATRVGYVPREGVNPGGSQVPRPALPGNPPAGGLRQIPKHVELTAVRPYSGCPLGYLGPSAGAPDTHPPEDVGEVVGSVRKIFRLTPREREQYTSRRANISKSVTWRLATSWIASSPAPEVPTPPTQCQSVQTHAGSWWEHHDALGRRWAAVERSQRAEAEAVACHVVPCCCSLS
jgi:hypothetical protein